MLNISIFNYILYLYKNKLYFMSILKKLWQKTLIYKTYDFIRSISTYIKDYNYISDTLYSHEFKGVIMKYLKCKLDKDWIGRLYGIINPNIDINGNLDITSIIIEMDDSNTNSEEYVKNWIYRQLNLISSLFKIEKLYNYISLDITHVGAENHDNYLLVFDITSRKYMGYSFKRMIIHLFVYLLIFGLIMLFI